MRLKRVSPLAKELALENLEKPFAYTERGLVSVTFREMSFSQILSGYGIHLFLHGR
jgi:hypothetical protein